MFRDTLICSNSCNDTELIIKSSSNILSCNFKIALVS
nr:MAG TPA: hypothetical protein [Caudoviricetes sp.]